METYTAPKELVVNPHYQVQRKKNIGDLTDSMIDKPLIEIVNALNKLTYCFTIQCCFGHFLYKDQMHSHNIEPLPVTNGIEKVEYRIAYIAFCIENNDAGKLLLERLKGVTIIDPKNIQFCCAEWFWNRQVNSYALQVEPDRFKNKDSVMLDYKEALCVEKIRNDFFPHIHELLKQVI